MKFLDTNIIIYNFSGQKKNNEIFHTATKIMARIDSGEEVCTSIAHLSEVANIIETKSGSNVACEVMEILLHSRNIKIILVYPHHYQIAVEIAKNKKVSINDCLAQVLMNEHSIEEIYSFDKDFDKLNVQRITK